MAENTEKEEIAEEKVRLFIEKMRISRKKYFYNTFIALVRSALEIEARKNEGNEPHNTPLDIPLSNTKINSELKRIAGLSLKYKQKMTSLDSDVIKWFDDQQIFSGILFEGTREPMNLHTLDVLDTINIYCNRAKQNKKESTALPTTKIKEELNRIGKLTSTYRYDFGFLNRDAARKLNEQHFLEGMQSFFDKDSFLQTLDKMLTTICTFCEQAKLHDDKTSDYLNIECLLADTFEECHGIIKKSTNGSFANLLRVFRERCDIREFHQIYVGKVRIERIQERQLIRAHQLEVMSKGQFGSQESLIY